MPQQLEAAGLVYLLIINVTASIVTIADKISAKRRRRRVPEATLLWLSALGGSPAMLTTMLLIRHKTRHVKFMAGIPLIIAAQIAVLFFLFHGLPHFI